MEENAKNLLLINIVNNIIKTVFWNLRNLTGLSGSQWMNELILASNNLMILIFKKKVGLSCSVDWQSKHQIKYNDIHSNPCRSNFVHVTPSPFYHLYSLKNKGIQYKQNFLWARIPVWNFRVFMNKTNLNSLSDSFPLALFIKSSMSPWATIAVHILLKGEMAIQWVLLTPYIKRNAKHYTSI